MDEKLLPENCSLFRHAAGKLITARSGHGGLLNITVTLYTLKLQFPAILAMIRYRSTHFIVEMILETTKVQETLEKWCRERY